MDETEYPGIRLKPGAVPEWVLGKCLRLQAEKRLL